MKYQKNSFATLLFGLASAFAAFHSNALSQQIDPAKDLSGLPDNFSVAAKPKGRGLAAVWVGCESEVGLERASKTAKALSPQIGFMKRLALADVPTANGYALVGKPVDNVIAKKNLVGWVNEKILVRSELPLPAKEGSYLFKKLKIINSRASLAKAKQADDKLVKVFRSIQKNQAKSEPVPIYLSELFYVYGEADHQGQDYYLIGNANKFSLDSPEQVVQGWVPANRTSLWPSRIALEWHWDNTNPSWAKANLESPNVRSVPGCVIAKFSEADSNKIDVGESIQLAKDYVTGKLAEAKLRKEYSGFDEEFDENGRSVPFQPSDSRMVVLDKINRPHPAINNSLYKVGWEGKFTRVAELETLQEKLDEIEYRANNIEILFVIDRTGSMERIFNQLALALAELSLEITQDPKRKVRFSFSFYNSIVIEGAKDEKPDISAEALTEISNWRAIPGFQRFLTDFQSATDKASATRVLQRNQRKYGKVGLFKSLKRLITMDVGDGGEYLHEPVFDAMLTSIETAFTQDRSNAFQMVIVIGDSGDISSLGNGDFRDKARDVSKELGSRNFKSIQFPNPNRDRSEYESNGYNDFSRQMRFLAKSDSDVTVAESVEAVKNKVKKPISDLAGEAQKLKEEIEKLRKSGFHSTPGSSLIRQLNDSDKKALEKIRSAGSQIYEVGYVWHYGPNGLPQVRHRVLLKRDEIRDLAKMLENILRPIGSGDKKSIYDGALQAAKELSGEDDSWDKLWKKRLDLPMNSKLLSISKKDLDKMERVVTKESIELTKELMVKHARLVDLLGEGGDGRKEVGEIQFEDYRVDKDQFGKLTVSRIGVGRKTKRFFKFESDPQKIDWCWLDLAKEIP